MTEHQTEEKLEDVKPSELRTTRREYRNVLVLATVWSVILSNPSKFFIGIGIAPIDTLSFLFGAVLVPIIPSYLLAKLICKLKNISFYKTWMSLLILILTVQTIGIVRSTYGI